MKLLHESRKVREVEYFAVFYYEDGLSGFRFPCNSVGVVLNLPALAAENYERCLNRDLSVVGPVIEKDEITFTTASIYQCPCGQELLEHNDCPHCLALAS